MTWHAQLQLHYDFEADRTVVRFRHEGPLRILQSLYPEGNAVCHNVLVHPPGGLVGGDTLDITTTVASGAHGLVTTPGATRFYRSTGVPAGQHTQVTLAEGARLEWLPLETLCYSACMAENRLIMNLGPQAELLGWDITALGLPGANLPFQHGQLQQHIEFPGVWLERGRIDATDRGLMDGPLGLAGQRCMASIFFVTGSTLARHRREAALDIAREIIGAHPLAATAGATSLSGQVLIVRVLAPLVEPAMDLMKHVRAAWRAHFWQLPAVNPRIWVM